MADDPLVHVHRRPLLRMSGRFALHGAGADVHADVGQGFPTPAMRPNFLSAPGEAETLVEGMRNAWHL